MKYVLISCLISKIVQLQDIKDRSLQPEKRIFNSDDLISILDYHKRKSSNDDLKTSLQVVMDFVEHNKCDPKDPIEERTNQVKLSESEANLPVKLSPTEDDLQKGCFTDVSFAGSFGVAQLEESVQELWFLFFVLIFFLQFLVPIQIYYLNPSHFT